MSLKTFIEFFYWFTSFLDYDMIFNVYMLGCGMCKSLNIKKL